jgi:hypothetical protein
VYLLGPNRKVGSEPPSRLRLKTGASGLQPRNSCSPETRPIQKGMSFTYYKAIRLSISIGCGLVFIIFAVANCFRIYINLLNNNIWFNDFFGLWSYANFEFENSVSDIYNNDIMLEFQMGLGTCPKCLLPYAYPPFFLFYILPLGILPYTIAYLFWALGSVTLYLVASLYKHLRRYAVFLILFAPATITCFATGQTGLLSSALIVGGFGLVTTRPILGGVLFGLASFKPQLGVLIPIALISARLWRAIAAACVTVLVLVLASGVAFGWSIWQAPLPCRLGNGCEGSLQSDNNVEFDFDWY